VSREAYWTAALSVIFGMAAFLLTRVTGDDPISSGLLGIGSWLSTGLAGLSLLGFGFELAHLRKLRR